MVSWVDAILAHQLCVQVNPVGLLHEIYLPLDAQLGIESQGRH